MLMELIAALLCCQFTVTVEPVIPSFTVVVEDPPSTVDPVEPNPPPEQPDRYLAMFTTSWCGYCRTWDRNTRPQVEAAGIHVHSVKMDGAENQRKYGRKINLFPSFVVVDWKTGEWISEVHAGTIDLATAKRMLGGSDEKPANAAVTRVQVNVSPPVRYIEWPGWGVIDLETYNRNCNCGMCVSIRAQQAEYWKQKREYEQSQTEVTPDQEGCPHDVVENMLDSVQLLDDDVLGDMGCGDGRILIAAARRGIRGIGVEIDPVRASLARRNVEAAGVERLVTIETGDVLDFDMNRVTVVTAYLYPPLLAKLSDRLRTARVVASPFHQIPGLLMKRHGSVWIYRSGG